MLGVKRILAIIGILALLLTGAYFIGRKSGMGCVLITSDERVDTLFICDTITQYKPIYKEIRKVEKVPVPVVDTLRLTDTLYVYLDREQVVWQDSLSKVYASGILPQIDSVHHFINERVVTRELTRVVKKPCRWGIGLQGGYGIGVNGGKVIASPYIGIGVYYNIISW